MKIIRPSYEILSPRMDKENVRNAIYRMIERAGRTCYKSESKITDESSAKFVEKIVANHHEAMLEHAGMSVRFIVDRGVSHELVRHRLASFAQESTRYCNYGSDKFRRELTYILPCFFYSIPEERRAELILDSKLVDNMQPIDTQYIMWYTTCKLAENNYLGMILNGASPEVARSVLPNSLKTEIVMTANMREWRHFFKLRAAGTTGKPHPQMQEVAAALLKEVQSYMPELFGDIVAKEETIK